MAYIRIPTGVKTVTATASRKSYIYYQCSQCGQPMLFEYNIKKEASASYHAFQSSATKERIENETKVKVSNLLNAEDAALYDGINVYHNYDVVDQKVKCLNCKKIQEWSNIPCEWKKSKLFWPWIIILGLSVIGNIQIILIDPKILIVSILLTAPIAMLPLFRKLRRKKQ